MRIPLDPDLRLALYDQQELKPISGPNDLRGMVRIRTSADALLFLRLFSAPETFYRFPQYGIMEVTPTPAKNVGRPGEMDELAFKKLELPMRRVGNEKGGFRVLRTAAQVDVVRWKVLRLVVLSEFVGFDGEYSMQVVGDEPFQGESFTILGLLL